MNLSFNNWLYQEGKDIFGFDRDIRPERKDIKNSMPVNTYDIEKIIKTLSKHNIGQLLPEAAFVNEIKWGQGPEGLRVTVNNWLNIVIERKTTDLLGNEKWITKKVYQLNHNQYGGTEDAIAQEILQETERVYRVQQDSPKNEYRDFQNLVLSTANTIRRNAHDIFVYEGIRRINENNYIIRLSLRGHGVQRKGQKRVEENHTQMTFNPETGLIRLTNYNLESPLGEHKWNITQTDIDWNFAPTQPKDEISQAISTVLHWY